MVTSSESEEDDYHGPGNLIRFRFKLNFKTIPAVCCLNEYGGKQLVYNFNYYSSCCHHSCSASVAAHSSQLELSVQHVNLTGA